MMNSRVSRYLVVTGVLLATAGLFQNCRGPQAAQGSSATASSLGVASVPSLYHASGAVGLGEPLIDNLVERGWDLPAQLDRVVELRPAMFRLWMTGRYLYDAQGHAIADAEKPFTDAITRLQTAGIQVLGMQSYFPSWMTGAEPNDLNWNRVPCLTDIPSYARFLYKYEAHWEHMATLFPQIKLWEPANETNGISTLAPIQIGAGSCGKAQFTHDERVFITIQLMERARRAIKRVSPDALVVLPPPGPQNDELALSGPSGSGDPQLVTVRRFITDIYKTIGTWHGSPRSYFDVVAWHPYIYQDATTESWVNPNLAIHDAIVAAGDGQVPIIFSEVGNSELNPDLVNGGLVARDPTTLSLWMQDAIRLTQEKLPFVSHVIWFRGFDDHTTVSWSPSGHEIWFGLLKDDYPKFTRKPSADMLCKFTGCVDEPFRARDAGGAWNVFSVKGTSYCKYASAADFSRLTGQDYDANLPFLAALDPSAWTYVGSCH